MSVGSWSRFLTGLLAAVRWEVSARVVAVTMAMTSVYRQPDYDLSHVARFPLAFLPLSMSACALPMALSPLVVVEVMLRLRGYSLDRTSYFVGAYTIFKVGRREYLKKKYKNVMCDYT